LLERIDDALASTRHDGPKVDALAVAGRAASSRASER
jgi:ABC-type transporter Mla maintaining outer membrane lipid asymmetry permease subunit MlaE